MSAAGLLWRVRDAGGRVRAEGVELVVTALAGVLTPQLLEQLREHKAQVLAVLTGEACRWCEAPIDWRVPGGVTIADGTAAHLACYERAEIERRTAQLTAGSPEKHTGNDGE